MSCNVAALSLIPLTSPAKKASSLVKICCSQNTTPNQQQPNLSVLRFTLGIPGLDESYLPRYIGYAFGALLVLNHFVASHTSSISSAQLRTEALGLSLASFSAVVPYLGKFLKGATPTDEKSFPEDAEQIFAMSQDISDNLKEDLAWGTYVLLRNTNSISVGWSYVKQFYSATGWQLSLYIEDGLCVRGYWNTPKDLLKENVVDWFSKQTQRMGFSNLKDALYFQQDTDSELNEMVPVGTRSLLVQPILERPEKRQGFVLLASSIDYAYTNKDKAWIAAIADKFHSRISL